ncbi:hypothetical protein P558_00447 [Staphylococcus aureus M1417]|nr:CAT RNA binding domain-containing protein [Staphylococcus aureus]EVQ83422.1 hypothetical protein P558_00447 [Staphylococcus aureus M1417]
MGEYIVTKTLNNNVVVCTNNDQEVIFLLLRLYIGNV